jgi:hypothetical protein
VDKSSLFLALLARARTFASTALLLAGLVACAPAASPGTGTGTAGAAAGASGSAGVSGAAGNGAAGASGAAGTTSGGASGTAGAAGGRSGAGGAGTAGAAGSGGSVVGGGSGTGGTAGTAGGAGRGGGGGAAGGSGGTGTAGQAGTGGATGTGGAAGGGTSDGAVTTNRYDNVRSGANLGETALTVASVGGGKFGLLFSRMVDGHVYAQPLVLPNLTIGGAKHNVVYVATEANTVFAYDADSASATTPLWMKSLGTPMRTYPGIENQPVVPPNTVSCRDMYPQTGITSTPVIDRATGRMYVVSKNFENNVYTQRLHALDVLTGQEIAGSPVNITGSVPGTALDGNGTTVPFDPQRHLNRPGLLLVNGTIFIAFASHCDDEPYHGWIFAYAADTLAQKAIFCTTPNGGTSMSGAANAGLGGIWQSGMGLVADGSDIYFAAGNGAFDTTNKGAQLGISLGRMQLQGTAFKVMDWFTPSAAQSMNDQDLDYTTAPVLLPNPRVILMGGKDQYLNVFDPANLGKYNAGGDVNLQKLTVSGHSHGGPVYWNGPSGPTVYLWPETANLRAYRFTGNRINTTAVSQFTSDSPTHPGGTLSLSASGATAGSGVLWATFTSTKVDATSGHMGDAWHYLVPGAFYAFDANNLTTPIWTSTANKARDDLGMLAKFNAPTVANGKVYVASQVAPMSDASSTAAGKLQVYGLMP